jgi:hypothetical protein
LKNKLIIILIIFAALVFLGIARDQVIKSIVTVSASKILGAPVRINGLSIGILGRSIDIKGFKIYNQEGFPKGILLDLPRIRADLDLGALLGRRLHLKHIYVDLKELVLIKNAEGKLNVDSLKVAKKDEKARGKKETKSIPMQIDLVTLSIGRIVNKDLSTGKKPSVEVFDAGIKEKKYRNITSAQQLAALILVQAMQATTIRGAEIYGVSTLAGIGFLPLGVATVFTGKDYSKESFNTTYDRAYKISLEVLQQMGEVLSEDKEGGIVKGKINVNDVEIKIRKSKGIEIEVMARKYMLPEPHVAAGLLYEISEKIR